jgi:hypothetical protein
VSNLEEVLRDQIAKHRFVDVGGNAHEALGVSKEELDRVVKEMTLNEESSSDEYVVFLIRIHKADRWASAEDLVVKVLTTADVTQAEMWRMRNKE